VKITLGYLYPDIMSTHGDHGNVVGVSLPLLRRLLAELGVPVTTLWTDVAPDLNRSSPGP